MDAQTHLADTHLRLTISPIVLTYAVMEERLGIDYGYLRVRVELTNHDFVELAEYFTVQTGIIAVQCYRYQWMDGAQQIASACAALDAHACPAYTGGMMAWFSHRRGQETR